MDINANHQETSIEIEFVKLNTQIEYDYKNHEDVRYPMKVKLYRCIRDHLWLFPLVASLQIPLLIAVVYTSAVLHRHVEQILPYLSDSGTIGPQAGIFSQILDTFAVLLMISGFIRYKQLKYYIEVIPKDLELARRLNKKNFIAFLLILVGSFGIVLPGNFRSNEWVYPHSVGAAITFCSMYIYAYYMIHLANQFNRHGIESKPFSMTVFAVIGMLALIFAGLAALVSIILVRDKIWDNWFRLHWNAQQEAYWWHVSSTAGEWILMLVHSLIMVCLARRMKRFKDWDKVMFFGQ